jgi:hypothetical protein
MSQFLRILLLFIVFIFLYRLLKRFLISVFSSTSQNKKSSPFTRKTKKYENIEEAKYTDISDEDQKEKKV